MSVTKFKKDDWVVVVPSDATYIDHRVRNESVGQTGRILHVTNDGTGRALYFVGLVQTRLFYDVQLELSVLDQLANV